MNIVTPMTKHYEFSEDDFALSKYFLESHQKSYPHLYQSDRYGKSFKFVKRALIDVDAISFASGPGNQQDARKSGLNSKVKELRTDLSTFGWRHYCVPIAIRKTSDGKYVILNGRTRNKILTELRIKNRIVDIYECDDAAAQKFGVSSNMEQPPAGIATAADIIHVAKKSIKDGFLQKDYDSIYEWVCDACGTRFVEKKRREMVNQILNHVNAEENGHKIVAWEKAGEVKAWMTQHNYVSQNGRTPIKYVLASYSVCSRTIFAACEAAQANPLAEIRVVLHTGNLTAFDLVECYVNRILDFKKEWNSKLGQVSNGFFGGAKFLNNQIKLYGCIPALSVLHNLDELIIFGKNDQKISESFLTSRGVSSVFDLEEYNQEDETEDDEVETI